MTEKRLQTPKPSKENEFSYRLLNWFSFNSRDFPWRHETNPYKILVTEKLLQQTTYGHVLRAYDNFFEKFPDIKTLAKAEVNDIETAIQRLGFQKQRAKQLKKIGSVVINEYNCQIPCNKKDLIKLNGIGDYISNAVLCFAFGKDVPIVDVNVRRVVKRVFSWGTNNDKILYSKLAKLLPVGRSKQFNWGIIDFSAQICSRKPKCNQCFLIDICKYFENAIKEKSATCSPKKNM